MGSQNISQHSKVIWTIANKKAKGIHAFVFEVVEQQSILQVKNREWKITLSKKIYEVARNLNPLDIVKTLGHVKNSSYFVRMGFEPNCRFPIKLEHLALSLHLKSAQRGNAIKARKGMNDKKTRRIEQTCTRIRRTRETDTQTSQRRQWR